MLPIINKSNTKEDTKISIPIFCYNKSCFDILAFDDVEN